MSRPPKVVIVVARCRGSHELFGIRFEQQERCWTADWAFALKESSARKEGYDQNQISGTFGFASQYPGCPACRASGLVLCVCGRVACWDCESRTVKCPWCGHRGTVAGQIERLKAGGDR